MVKLIPGVMARNLFVLVNTFEVKSQVLLSDVQSVSDHHGNSEGAHTPWDRSDDRGLLSYGFKVHISHHLHLPTLRLNAVNS